MNKKINNLENEFNKAEELRNKGKFIESIEIFENILKENSKFHPALNNIANCYFQLNQLEQAEKYYLISLKTSKNIFTLNNLSLLNLKRKNFKKALPMLRESLKIQSNQEHIIEKIAYCLTELNLNSEVEIFCKKFIKVYPKNNVILSYYRKVLFKTGKHQEALRAYKKETGIIELDNDKVNVI